MSEKINVFRYCQKTICRQLKVSLFIKFAIDAIVFIERFHAIVSPVYLKVCPNFGKRRETTAAKLKTK